MALHPEEGKAGMPLPLTMDVRVRIAAALVDGNSLGATARMVGANRETVGAFALRVGQGCQRIHNCVVRDVAAYLLSGDETWSFCKKKQARVTEADAPDAGDLYTFVALDSTSKLVVSYLAGKRDQESTDAFIADLRARLSVAPHFSTDGWQPYISAVAEHFRGSIDYGMVVKQYGYAKSPDYEVPATTPARRHDSSHYLPQRC
jgi:IS1 family transposase